MLQSHSSNRLRCQFICRRACVTAMAACLIVAVLPLTVANVAAQEDGDTDLETAQREIRELRSEVDVLNNRIATLERLLLTRIIEAEPDDIGQLQSELDLANERMEHTQRLFEKGYVSELELSSDQYNVERAQLRLELAAMAADQAEFAASIQLFEAQAMLDMALQRLGQSEKLAARGYITEAQLRADQLDVERARSRVAAIRQKLAEGDEVESDETDQEPDEEN